MLLNILKNRYNSHNEYNEQSFFNKALKKKKCSTIQVCHFLTSQLTVGKGFLKTQELFH